ncbi:MAG: hypothetical protein ABIH49_03015 [archaeon]
MNIKENEIRELRPPYAGSGQADAALELFKRQVPKKIDKKFVIANNLATPTNAFRIIDFYKWLGITDADDNVREDVAKKLRLTGDEREKYIRELVEEAYQILIESVSLENARKEDIVNAFITNYDFTHIQAKFAAALFIHLCQKYSIQISDELKKKNYVPSDKEKRRKIIPRKKIKDTSSKLFPTPQEKIDGKVNLIIRGNGIHKILSANTPEELDEIYKGKLKDAVDAAKLLCFDKD